MLSEGRLRNKAMSPSGNRAWFKALWQSGVTLALASILGLGVNHLRPDGISLQARWSPEAQLHASPSDDNLIVSMEEAQVLYFSEQAVFVDARPDEAYEAGHIKGARSLPWEAFEDRFSETMADVPIELPIIVYCDGEGCGLSKELTFGLLEKGYKDVRVLVNGWSLWQQANLPTE